MQYDPNIHQRRSIRLQGYDYSQRGAYFVTICMHNRECMFGDVQQNSMVLNDAGRMIEGWWNELPRKYPMIDTDAFIVMPNHVHGIIAIAGADPGRVIPTVGAARSLPSKDEIEGGRPVRPLPITVGAALRGRPNAQYPIDDGQPHRVAPTLGAMINWFKTMTTNAYIRGVKQHHWRPFSEKFWQRNYYEHVIRDEGDLHGVREYIAGNPAGWDRDEENPAAGAGLKPAPMASP